MTTNNDDDIHKQEIREILDYIQSEVEKNWKPQTQLTDQEMRDIFYKSIADELLKIEPKADFDITQDKEGTVYVRPQNEEGARLVCRAKGLYDEDWYWDNENKSVVLKRPMETLSISVELDDCEDYTEEQDNEL